MSASASRVLPSRVVLGVAVAGMFVVAMAQPALGGGPPDAERGFVLLSMEQAAMFHATDIAGCTGTANRPACFGTSALCNWYSGQNCPAFARTYPAQPVRYCTCWDPNHGAPGTCKWNGLKLCYNDAQCAVDPTFQSCAATSQVFPAYDNDDWCDLNQPYTPPKPVP